MTSLSPFLHCLAAMGGRQSWGTLGGHAPPLPPWALLPLVPRLPVPAWLHLTQLLSSLHHYQVPCVWVFLCGWSYCSWGCRGLSHPAQLWGWTPTSPPGRTEGGTGAWAVYPGQYEARGLLWPDSAWERAPPSHGRPGPPAFGCSFWPGRWLEGQGTGLRGATPPLPLPQDGHPSSLTKVQLGSWPQGAGPEVQCLVRRRQGCVGRSGPSALTPGVGPTLSLPWEGTVLGGLRPLLPVHPCPEAH